MPHPDVASHRLAKTNPQVQHTALQRMQYQYKKRGKACRGGWAARAKVKFLFSD